MAESSRDLDIPPAQDWELELLRSGVESKFTAPHHRAVLDDLEVMRAELSKLFGRMFTPGLDSERLVCMVVRAQLEAVERSGGDPAFFTDKRYNRPDYGQEMDRDLLVFLDSVIRDRQMMAKDMTSLVKMLDDAATRMDALSVLRRKGDAGAAAVPRLVDLLREGDQLECCAALRTLAGIGPAARGAVPAAIELVDDQDWLIRRATRAALRAMVPERASESEEGK
jgi:hypothetical protein